VSKRSQAIGDETPLTPTSTPLAALSLGRRQREALRFVVDALIPSLPAITEAADFWHRRASDLDVDRHIVEIIAVLPRRARREFTLLLAVLASPLPGLLMGGWPRSFGALRPVQRENLLQRWAASRVPTWRMAFASLKRICCFIYYGITPDGSNPNWLAIGYPPPPREPATEPPAPGLRVTLPDQCIECDTLVIGSGAGGGVVAATLAEHGQDVVVVDKGDHVPLAERSNLEFDMVSCLYEGRGMQASEDHAVSLFAGSCLGGGTTVNWSVSLRPGEALLHEWASQHGLPQLLSREFTQCVDEVCARMGVVGQVPHNAQNRALLEGSARLGHAAGPLPQNVRGCERHAHQHCGYCLFGCRHGHKQDVTEAFLRGAQARASVRIHARTQVRRLHQRGGAITHAEGHFRAEDGSLRPVTIRARRYVLAAGAIHTPALLLASGFSHPHLGRHLYVHPTQVVIGQYARCIDSWQGGMMTSYSDAAANQDGHHYGCKIETAPLHSGLLASLLPWRSGMDHKRLMLAARHYAGFAVITRDRFGGQVRLDRDGQPRVRYRLHAGDRGHSVQGMAAAVSLHAAAGAESVLIAHHAGLRFQTRRQPLSTERYRAELAALDWSPNRFPLLSSHLMGTCRMGGRRADSPVTPDGRFESVRNLYVADGSVFPSASGINPMVTIQSLARHTALCIAAQGTV
jgi:choline dehydrogenase-like flavoprotein